MGVCPAGACRDWMALRRPAPVVRRIPTPKPGYDRLPDSRLIFAHGVSFILAPSFGTETLKRGETYVRYALGGLTQLPDDEVYRALIGTRVRICFYGDYEHALTVTGLRSALETCAMLIDATASGEDRCCL